MVFVTVCAASVARPCREQSTLPRCASRYAASGLFRFGVHRGEIGRRNSLRMGCLCLESRHERGVDTGRLTFEAWKRPLPPGSSFWMKKSACIASGFDFKETVWPMLQHMPSVVAH